MKTYINKILVGQVLHKHDCESDTKIWLNLSLYQICIYNIIFELKISTNFHF